MSLMTPLVVLFRSLLQPIAPFTYFGLGTSTLDLLATVRLCLVMRQVREMLHNAHVKEKGREDEIEERSFVRNAATTLVVVYGGEAITAPFLGQAPSFFVSGAVPFIYTLVQALVDKIPAVPSPSLHLELPLSILDGFSRSYLLCTLIPPSVTTCTGTHATAAVSPWCLLVTSFIVANGGFFFSNLLSLFHPTPLRLQTPPELQAYGWMTTDLWAAPLFTGLFALLTHAQPFWAEVHQVLGGLLGVGLDGKPLEPVDPEVARALCALLLSGLFTGRTVKNFMPQIFPDAPKRLKQEKAVQ